MPLIAIIGIGLLVLWLIFVIFRLVFHWVIHLLPLIAVVLIIIWLVNR